MPNMQAAMGVAQLERLESFIHVKHENYLAYKEHGIDLLPYYSNVRPNYWFYSYISSSRDKLIRELNQRGIQSRPVWKLIHTLPMYKKCRHYQLERSFWYYDRIINLPCSSNLTHEDVIRVATIIQDCESL